MSITRADARASVRAYVDDAATQGTPRYSDTDVERPLKSAQAEVMQLVLAAGTRLFQQSATVSTDANGLASLTSLAPLQISDVSIITSGTDRTVLKRREPRHSSSNAVGVNALTLVYVPRVVFPAADATAFSWAGVDQPMMDDLMCLIAASQLKATVGEMNQVLEMRKAELRASIMNGFGVSSWRPIVGGTRSYSRQLYWYMPNPDTLQLLYS